MSYMCCCVPGCTVTAKHDIVLHRFPNPKHEKDRFQRWVESVGEPIKDLDYNFIYQNRRVCRRHFPAVFHYPKNRLCKLSVPTLFMQVEHSGQAEPVQVLNFEQPTTAAVPGPADAPIACSVGEPKNPERNPKINLTFVFTGLPVIEKVIAVDRALDVHFGDGNSIKFEDCWLRDHCRCPTCYHSDTFQRAHHILDIPDVVDIVNIKHDMTKIEVTWSDDHKSSFTAEFLAKFDYKKWKECRKLKPILWHGSIENKISKVPVDEFLTSVGGAKRVFQSLLDYGVALIEGVDVSIKATEAVCKALGGVQHTIFGGMWQFTTRADHADTAYTNLPLAVHNDNTYFTEAAGLQILHCLEHKNGTGGETILVDGFYGATELKDDSIDDFYFLTTFNVEAEYIEDGHHHKYSAPIIRVDNETKELIQIRFNVYDRAAMAFSSSEECRSYYRSLRSLAKYYQDPNNQWKFKLKPGTVMVMDNFRVLHGRTSFSGSRVLGGSYVSRSDWLDKARALGLIQ